MADDLIAEKGKSLVPRPEHAISLDGDDEDDERPAFLALPPAENQEAWYPTLRVTLWVLSCLWSYVDVSFVFPNATISELDNYDVWERC